MRPKTPFIVPATVPDAQVTRLVASAPEGPTVISAEPAPVPVPLPLQVVPEQLTAEQVELLRAENAALREELERVRNL
jgi:hypothetical protein